MNPADYHRTIDEAILDVLSPLDGGLMTEAILHAAVERKTTPRATLADFEERLRYCETRKWITGRTSPFGGARKWAITDAGEIARREMRNG